MFRKVKCLKQLENSIKTKINAATNEVTIFSYAIFLLFK